MTILIASGFDPDIVTLGREMLKAIDVSVQPKGNGVKPGQFSEKYVQARQLNYEQLSLRGGQSQIGGAYEFVASEFVISNSELVQWGWADQNSVFLLDFWKEFEPTIRFVFLYCAPEKCFGRFFERSAQADLSVERYLENWRLYYERVLSFYLRNQDISVLINLESAMLDFDRFRQLTGNHFGLRFISNSIPSFGTFSSSHIGELVARAKLFRDVASQELFEEIEDCADFPSLKHAENEELSLNLALEEFRTLKAKLEYAQSEVERLKTEIDLATSLGAEQVHLLENMQFELDELFGCNKLQS